MIKPSRVPAVESPSGKYVIINDVDAPEPNMVCQWVQGLGYCYMDRGRLKPRFDGMRGAKATDIEAFGFRWAEDTDGMTRFYLSDIPPTARYQDGAPRRWQSLINAFEWPTLRAAGLKKRRA